MNFKINCALAVLTVMLFDSVHGGALKKHFEKNERPNIETKEQKASSDKNEGNESETQKTEPASSAVESSDSVENSSDKKKIVGDPVVLRINGKKEFRRSQILNDMKMIPPQMVQGLSPDKLFEMLRDQKLNAFLMVEQAKKAGMDRTKEFLDRIDQLKEELLGRTFLMKELAPKAENESTLKTRYTKYLVEFKKGKEFKIFHIMLDKEDEAKQVLSELGKGNDFSKLAREKSVAPSKDNGGEEGYIPVDLIPAPIKDKIILLKKGEYTKEFVKVEGGFHIFKVDDIRDATPYKYDEAVPMLKQTIMREEMMKLLDRLKKQVKVEIFNEDGTTFKETATTAEKQQ